MPANELFVRSQISEIETMMPSSHLALQGVVSVYQDGVLTTSRDLSAERRALHEAVHQHQPELRVLVQYGAPYALALSCREENIPAFDYRIARFGGRDVRCTLRNGGVEGLLQAMEQRHGCLIFARGMLVGSTELPQAMKMALEMESLCEHYWNALQAGKAKLAGEKEMNQALRTLTPW